MLFRPSFFGGVILMGLCAAAASARPAAGEYLSDTLDRLAYARQGWGELGIDVCAHASGQIPLALRIKDKTYQKGLGHHAPGEIVVELNGEYSLFEAEVGVQWQMGHTGSVVFQVFVDRKKRFDSGIMKETDPARPVRISLKGAQELRLVAGDAGDGITCDCANWANARLARAVGVKPRPPEEPLDIAPFARVATWDPDRADGSRASRVEEFRAEDVCLESDLVPGADGDYTVPVAQNGWGCIGLQWLERRRIQNLGVEFPPGSPRPPEDGVRVEGWVGESAWQGTWKALRGTLEPQKERWLFRIDWKDNPEGRGGELRKIRWLFPPSAQPTRVRRLTAFTDSRWGTGELSIHLERPMPGHQGEIEMYNGAIVSASGSCVRCKWDLGRPLRVKVRYSKLRLWKSDRTVLRLRLPDGAFGVAVEDVLQNGCVYIRDFGVFVTCEPARISLAQYKRKIAGRKTVLERVREMPDQTFQQAQGKVHHAIQNNGPMMLSLACDNHKFVVQRTGSIQFERFPDDAARLLIYPLRYSCELIPQFGSGRNEKLTRHLDGGWLPVPVLTVEEGGAIYRQRTFVVPYEEENSPPQALSWLSRHPLCVAEFEIENPQSRTADISLRLAFLSDAQSRQPAGMHPVDRGAVVQVQDRLLAFVDTGERGALRQEIQEGVLTLKGSLPPQEKARCFVYIPAWGMKSEEYGRFKGGERLLPRVKAYWEKVLAGAMQVEVPEPMLMNVIRASQLHCLIAARNEEEGKRIAPWIASMVYGPLESEANSIIRGMDLMGHHDFARRALDFFIRRYNAAGYLTTGYTMMGTGWHLWTLGEHYELTQDVGWLKRVAPEVARVCRWIARQRKKTEKLDPYGEKMPEYGLMPPGVMADWNAFACYFCLNGYYYAGLQKASDALADIQYPGADLLLQDAGKLRDEILRAYRWTQARMPVLPLQDGTWVPGYPSQVHCPGPTDDFFPGEDGNRSWAYDVELGAHQMVPQGVLDAGSRDVAGMMEHMEDVAFLSDGLGDYPGEASHRDPFNLGGFAKVQPYYARNAEIYALRDDVKPFIRSYFNTIFSLLNTENLSFWEHFHNMGAWNKTHETGYFLQQTRLMLVMERGEALWLAPFVTGNWLKDGMTVAVVNAPTRFGPVSYRITSSVRKGFIEAVIEPPTRRPPQALVIRLRHPEGKRIRAVTVNGMRHTDFDRAKECVIIKLQPNIITVRVSY